MTGERKWEMTDQTPGGVIVFCDYLSDKGYATDTQVNPWKIAVRKVFQAVEREEWESYDLSTIDLDEYLDRFQKLVGAQYKVDSITAYKRRIANAIEAHRYYLETGKPPTFRRGSRRSEDKGSGSVVKLDSKSDSAETPTKPSDGLHPFSYPLNDGRFVTLELPPRMKGDDVNRVCAFIRTLQDDSPEAKQLPERSGEAAAAA